jgi:hypothetical protein
MGLAGVGHGKAMGLAGVHARETAPDERRVEILGVIAVAVYMCLFLLVAQWWRDYSQYRAREREEKRRAKKHGHF